MRTLLNKTVLIEKYLQGDLNVKDRFLFDARLLLDPELKEDLYFQRKAILLVKMYHRKRIKEELEIIHKHLFNNPLKSDFQQAVYQLFKPSQP